MSKFIRITNNTDYDALVNVEKVEYISKVVDEIRSKNVIVQRPAVRIQYPGKKILSVSFLKAEDRDNLYEHINDMIREKEIPKFEFHN